MQASRIKRWRGAVRRILWICVSFAVALGGCSEGDTDRNGTPGSTRESPPAPAESAAGSIRPSIVLVVVESLRTDVVASYGRDLASPFGVVPVSATPNLDSLSESGLRYAWAFSASPETVASHTSILTGSSAEKHGVGLWTEAVAPTSLTMLAESLRDAGYETAGFAENPMVSGEYGLAQGFETFEVPSAEAAASHLEAEKDPAAGFGLLDRIKRWHAKRDPSRPYFLFVNLFDPHLPLSAEANDPFLPDGIGKARLKSVLATDLRRKICRDLPDPATLEIIRGLYKAEVAQADRKLGEVLALTRSDPRRTPIMVVTADHGTHLGEERLLGHQFAVDNRVLRVPLVVEGPTVDAGVVETPVAQHRLAASIRCWSGEAGMCVSGLPTSDPTDPTEGETIVSIYGDERVVLPPSAVVDTGTLKGHTSSVRAICDREGGPFGRSVSFISPPMKMIWREGAPPRLYDLSWDPAERSNQMDIQKDVAKRMLVEVERFVRDARIDQVRREAPEGPLPARAAATYEAARSSLLVEGATRTDAVWFVQLLLRERADPELADWVEEQIPLHQEDPFFPIIAPDEDSPKTLPAEPGRGLAKWNTYMLAAVADPEPLALRYLGEYLGMMEESGYVLTHQVSVLEWARAKGRPLDPAVYGRLPFFLARMEAEHEKDTVFSDLWVERAAFLTAFGNPTPSQIDRWTTVLVENHLGSGDWGGGAWEVRFDGQSHAGGQAREHARGMAMIVLARYLAEHSNQE